MSSLIGSIISFILAGFAVLGLVPHQEVQPLPALEQAAQAPEPVPPLVQQAYNSEANHAAVSSTTLPAPATVSVPGMSKYTDPDFGFSFWYPSGWTVTVSNALPPNANDGSGYFSGGTFVKTLTLSNDSRSLPIYEYVSPSGAIVHGISAKADREGVYFDAAAGQWMNYSDYGSQGVGNYSSPANASNNTMGGLHIFPFNVVPLSAKNFVIVDNLSDYDSTQMKLASTLMKTIAATDPSVAIPVPTAQQMATIQAEASAYGVTVQSTPSTHPLTTIGQCTHTTITEIGTRLTNGVGGPPIPDSGSSVWYDVGLSQISYDTISGIQNSKVGDSVTLCLKSIPTNCPAGDSRGYVYDATNLRTGDTWEAADSEHLCGGA